MELARLKRELADVLVSLSVTVSSSFHACVCDGILPSPPLPMQDTAAAARESLTDAEAMLADQKFSGLREVDPLAPTKRPNAAPQDRAAGALLSAYSRTAPIECGFTLVGPVYRHVVILDSRCASSAAASYVALRLGSCLALLAPQLDARGRVLGDVRSAPVPREPLLGVYPGPLLLTHLLFSVSRRYARTTQPLWRASLLRFRAARGA